MKKRIMAAVLGMMLALSAVPVYAAGKYPIATEDYVFADSSRTLLSEDAVKDRSVGQLRVAKNEIYARHGRKFTSEDLDYYFRSKSWYSPVIEAKDFKESLLSSVEKKNVALIDSCLNKQLDGNIEQTAAERGCPGTEDSWNVPTGYGSYMYYGTNGADLELFISRNEYSVSLCNWSGVGSSSYTASIENDTVLYGVNDITGSLDTITVEFEAGGKYAFVSYDGAEGYDMFVFADRSNY